jgi:hypothetical protein
VGALGVMPGIASAAEADRPAPPASIDRDRDPGRDGRWGQDRYGHDRDVRWDRDRDGHGRDWDRNRDRVERERAEHERACHVAWERGASPAQLRAMRCY